MRLNKLQRVKRPDIKIVTLNNRKRALLYYGRNGLFYRYVYSSVYHLETLRQAKCRT